MERRLRRILAVVVAALLGAGIAAATNHPGNDDGLNLIAHAADAARDAGTARMAFSMSVSAPGQGEFTIDGSGAVDGDRAQMVMRLPHDPSVPGGAEMEFRIIGTKMFMRMPDGLAPEQAAFSTPWALIDLAQVDPAAAALFEDQMMGATDPAQTIDMLRGAADSFETVGREEVRGVATTRYRATVDMRKAAAEVPAEHRDAFLRSMEDLEEQLGSSVVPMDVWIDGGGLPRRVAMHFDASGIDNAPQGTEMTMTVEMFDYGVGVSIEPPPADQVTDVGRMMEQFSEMG